MKTNSEAAASPFLPRPPWTKQQAREVVALCDESGVSIAAFARQYGFPPHQLYTWRRRLAQNVPVPQFVPVCLSGDETARTSSQAHGTLELVRAGFTIRVSGRVDMHLLRDVLEVVAEVAC